MVHEDDLSEGRKKVTQSKLIFITTIIFLLLGLNIGILRLNPQLTPENQLCEKQITPPGITTQKMSSIQTYDPIYSPILVTSNDTFNSEGFTGLGTIDDPYKLEWKNITLSSNKLIEIRNTTAYFIICNNLLNGLNQSESGIILSNVTHGTIEDNIVRNMPMDLGIHLDSNSSNNIISNNTIYNCAGGIDLIKSNNTIISDNKLWGIEIWGVTIGDSNNITITNNTVNNGGGIGTETSSNTSISNNTVYNCTTGIVVSESSDITVSHNIIHDNIDYFEAISLGHSNNVIIFCNAIYNYSEGFALDSATHNTVANNTIYSCSHGFNIHTSSNYNSITQNVIYNCDTGIMFQDSDYNNIFNNDLSNNNQAFDNGLDNIFANNYWSDWTGTGSYIIGGEGNQDPSPLTNPFHISIPTITAPTSDTPILLGSVPIQWIASNDMFGHSINYSVFYSPNDGINWTLLSSGLTTINYTFDTTIITDGTSILLKVQAIDTIGFIAQSTSSTTFLILNGVSPPTVKFPNGGETLEGTETIEWKASLDPFEHAITYTVYYSSDNAATWTQLTNDLSSTSYSWDTTTVSDGLSYLIKVVAICSEGDTREDVSDSTFAIQNSKKTTSEASGIPILIFLLALVVKISVRKRKKS
ncbi:MAG: NosD domain-containing protein [Candidatus Hodarchaeota archaeon]